MRKYQTNNSSIELQVMRKFISLKLVQINHMLKDWWWSYRWLQHILQAPGFALSGKIWHDIIGTELEFLYEKVKSKIYQVTLTQEDYEKIVELFTKRYVLLPVKCISFFLQKVKTLSLDNEIIWCNSNGSSAHSYVMMNRGNKSRSWNNKLELEVYFWFYNIG